MRILHICICGPFTDGFEYQDNIIPRKHKEEGHYVKIITTTDTFNSRKILGQAPQGGYSTENGIPYLRLAWPKTRFFKYIRYVPDLYQSICDSNPDIIFVHGVQFFSLRDVYKYAKKHPDVKIYIDNHADYYNSQVKKLRTKILTYWIWGHYARSISKYTEKFWGVTPWRCQYLHEIFGISKDKIDLLVMGGDDDKIDFKNQTQIRKDIRIKHNIDSDAFLIVTGGKIDRAKNIHLLMQAVSELNNQNIKLIVFGQPNDEMKPIIQELSKNDSIRFIGWIQSDKAYDYFLAADLGFFPGTHSVLWEQACACGLPCVFKEWEGTRHVDVGGNCAFLFQDSADEIISVINEIVNDEERYASMKKIAVDNGITTFSYREIARRAIGAKEYDNN
jgi:1,2-diacylglycerol 3-alpha-glucosyltransferase